MAARKQQRQANDNPSTPAEIWGAELFHWRSTVRGMLQSDLAKLMHCDPSYISQLETARRRPKEQFVRQLDELLATGGVLERQLAYLKQNVSDYHPSWFRQYVELEGKAATLREWHPFYLSGLLQTEEYARAVFRTFGEPPDRVDELTEARLSRQRRLFDAKPLRLSVVMDEGVLWRVIGDHHVMTDQLRHLLELSRRPNITLQVVPRDAGVMAPGNLMTFLDLPKHNRWFYTESLDRGFCTDDPLELMQQNDHYDRIRSHALTVRDSRFMIQHILKEMVNMNPQPTDPATISWFKSTHSGGGNGGCIEVSTDLLSLDQVPVRDSKDPDGPNLLFSTEAFAAFRQAVVSGEFSQGEQYLHP
ncbi:Scr1 family TA system antitoxin-like transcriptional regulator [Kitasatospora sp. NPDC054939]